MALYVVYGWKVAVQRTGDAARTDDLLMLVLEDVQRRPDAEPHLRNARGEALRAGKELHEDLLLAGPQELRAEDNC